MEAKLKILGGKASGQEVAIPATGLLIGRAHECQLRPKSDFVSRQHAKIAFEESKLMIQDLGSRTGTYLNGHLIPPKRSVQLEHGDAVKIGPLEFGVAISHSLARKKKPKVESVEEAAARTAEQPAGDVDVTQWLKPSESEMAMNETVEVPPNQSVLDAADLVGQSDAAPPTEAEKSSKSSKPAPGGGAPDQVASDMLKSYLRRR